MLFLPADAWLPKFHHADDTALHTSLSQHLPVMQINELKIIIRILHFWSDMRNSTTQNLEPHKYYNMKTYKLEIEKFVFLYDFLS